MQRPMTADGSDRNKPHESKQPQSKSTASDSEIAEVRTKNTRRKERKEGNQHKHKDDTKQGMIDSRDQNDKVSSDNVDDGGDRDSELHVPKESHRKAGKRGDARGRHSGVSKSRDNHGVKERSSPRGSIRSAESLHSIQTGLTSGSDDSPEKYKHQQMRTPEVQHSTRKEKQHLSRKESQRNHDRKDAHDSTWNKEKETAQKADNFNKQQGMSSQSDFSNGSGSYVDRRVQHPKPKQRQGNCSLLQLLNC